jgi:hypothetical protein
MPSVTIDASVIALPPANTEYEGVLQYVETLLALENLSKKAWVTIYMSEFTSSAILSEITEDEYPSWPALSDLLNRCGLSDKYNVNTILKVVISFLSLQPYCEEVFGVREVLAEEVTLTPNLFNGSVKKPGFQFGTLCYFDGYFEKILQPAGD